MDITNVTTKPGWKTTEFWLTLLAVVVGLLASSGLFVDGGTVAKVLGIAASALASIGYTFARSSAKNTAASAAAVVSTSTIQGRAN